MKIYFAHAMTDYGNARERAAVTILERAGWEVINPNGPTHSAAVDAMRTAGHNVMDYFTGLVRAADATAYMLTEDGDIGPGVLKEVCEAYVWGKSVYRVGPANYYRVPSRDFLNGAGRVLTISEMRERVSVNNLKG